jgi:Tfp pilus assembly protein PilN
MPKKAAAIQINLLPKDPFYETALGKILKWALSIGRYIVIFTELVVIMSFASRFTLDRQLTDLNTAILQKQTIIESYGDLEQSVRTAQKKIDQYQQIQQTSNIADIFPKLSRVTPPDVRLDELGVTQDGIRFRGNTMSQQSLNLLISNLQLSPDFFNVTVDSIETGDRKDPGYHFSIRAETRQIQVVAPKTQLEQKVNVLDRTQGL